MNKHMRHCVAICQEAGLNVVGVGRRTRHSFVKCAEGNVICPGTPSDYRWDKNLMAHARRLKQR